MKRIMKKGMVLIKFTSDSSLNKNSEDEERKRKQKGFVKEKVEMYEGFSKHNNND